jgi:hypothetical protein
MLQKDIRRHYSRADVRAEIARFSAGRWAAAHCVGDRGPEMVRYTRSKRPLCIGSPEDVWMLYNMLETMGVRSFYASIHRYRWTGDRPVQVIASMPSWDVDLVTGRWEGAVETVEKIVSLLERYGVVRSVIVKWSGGGMHVHVNDWSFTESLFSKYEPLDVAYAVTEYILRRLGETAWEVRVENKVDPARVFTSPLSLHRELDMVCICLDPNRLYDFSPEWAQPFEYKHFTGWDAYEVGEADELALRALDTIGPYTRRPARRRVHPPLDEVIRRLQSRLGEGDMPQDRTSGSSLGYR